MPSVNKVILVGHLGAEPEVRTLQGGSIVANMRLATTEKWKDRDGNKQEKTEWHSLVAWGKTAEICEAYLHKGDAAYFEGKIEYRQYEKDGQTRYATDIKVFNMQLLGGGQKREPQPHRSQGFAPPPPPAGMNDGDDGLPF